MTNILGSYSSLHPRSVQLYQQALQTFPSGVTHDVRFLPPFPLYIERAQGCRKWDVDGNEIVDYVMGHGALMLGHSHPLLVEAVNSQIAKGTHYGACHELELAWANWVRRLMPSAEKVRFTNSGTEATLMAIRLARAYTGKDKIIKVEGCYHGAHDALLISDKPHRPAHMGPAWAPTPTIESAGVLYDTAKHTLVVPWNDPEALEQCLQRNLGLGDLVGVSLVCTGDLFLGSPRNQPIQRCLLRDHVLLRALQRYR